MDRCCLICNKRLKTYAGLTKHIARCTAKNNLPVFPFTFNQESNCDLQLGENGSLKRVPGKDYRIDEEFAIHLGTVDDALNSWATVEEETRATSFDDLPAPSPVVGQTQSTQSRSRAGLQSVASQLRTEQFTTVDGRAAGEIVPSPGMRPLEYVQHPRPT